MGPRKEQLARGGFNEEEKQEKREERNEEEPEEESGITDPYIEHENHPLARRIANRYLGIN